MSARPPLEHRDSVRETLIRKLESFEALSDQDRQALNELMPLIRQIGAGVDLIRQGNIPEHIQLILDGFACRYKILPNGQRQILAYLVPGDFCDLNVFILDQMDHSIGTISDCQVVNIPRSAIDIVTIDHPRITRALWWCTLVDEAVLREWLVNIGARQANQRIAHLICELLARLSVVGCVSNNSFTFPFTQTDIADTLGLSTVHVNRVLRELKELCLVQIKQKKVTVLDIDRLQSFCNFDPSYLHLMNTRWSNRRTVNWLKQSQRG